MKPFREAVRDILKAVRLGQPYAPFKGSLDFDEAINEILTAFEELVPEEREIVKPKLRNRKHNYSVRAWNACREEILKRLKEATRRDK